MARSATCDNCGVPVVTGFNDGRGQHECDPMNEMEHQGWFDEEKGLL